MSTEINLNKISLVIITGSSQGIGQKIAEVIAGKLKDKSKIVLIARSENGLSETKTIINNINKNIFVEIYPRDLSKPNFKDYEDIIDKLVQDQTYENAIIFHNAGQVATQRIADLNNLELWRNYYDLNMFSTALLNSAFVKKLQDKALKLYVINISSLCGSKPFANLGLYGSVKAARHLYFSVLAVEEPNIVVFQYCPGPVDTAMFNQVASNVHSAELRSQFQGMRENKVVLTTDQTVQKLFTVLQSGNFKSGDIIDYYD